MTIVQQKSYMVPQFYQGGSSGVPAVPATILMSALGPKICFRTVPTAFPTPGKILLSDSG